VRGLCDTAIDGYAQTFFFQSDPALL